MNKKTQFKNGAKARIPIALGYIPIAIAFGIMSKSSGIPNAISMSISLLLYAGASQFVGVNMMALGAASWELICG